MGSRLVKKSLFDADGSTLGSIQDILLVPAASENRLYLRGFVASVDRRLILSTRQELMPLTEMGFICGVELLTCEF